MNTRLISIIILLIIISMLCMYTGITHPWLNIKECLEHPEKYDGKLITEYWEPQIGTIYSDGFQLKQLHAPSIRVICDTSGLKTGKYVGMKAYFKKQGYLVAEKAIVADKREYKIWISVIPVLIILVLFIRCYNFNIKKFQFELRNNNA